jgi:hypothetical protein
MGLDVYAVRSPDEPLNEEDIRAFDEANIQLCGGIFSGDGGSFRGKVYCELVLELTEVSLYDEFIPPEKVRQMAAALHRVDLQTYDLGSQEKYRYDNNNSDTIRELMKFFDVCAARGLGLAGSW